MTRPNLRPVFVDSPKLPRVTFCTSSETRLLQARMVFGRFGLDLRHHVADDPSGAGHDGTSEQLLEQSVRSIRSRPCSDADKSYFFVENTSIRIEALSSASADVPGLAADEWFNRTTFAELATAIRSSGDNRAVIRSDIALCVPGIGRTLFFGGSTEGTVSPEPPRFAEDPHYPWLSSNSFSAWLVPDNSTLRLSEMSFEQSWYHDFRVKALCQLIERLEEYTVALNSPPNLYFQCSPGTSREPSARHAVRPLLAVVGPTCSGKTTFGDHAEAYDTQVIDASSVVRMLAEKQTGTPVDITEFAVELLDERGADFIARQIVELLDNSPDRRGGVIITGLRVIEEIEYLKSIYPDLLIVSLEATQEIRYERFLRRNTRARLRTYKDFQERDALQRRLGLLEVVEEIADVRIQNRADVGDFSRQVESMLTWMRSRADSAALGRLGVRVVDVASKAAGSHFIRCLEALRAVQAPLTVDRLSTMVGLRQDDVITALRGRSATVDCIENDSEMPRYQIRPGGEALLRIVRQSSESAH